MILLKKILFVLLIHTLLFLGASWALMPEEVLVVANRNAAKSEGLARYYMSQRKIPDQNLVLLFMADKETCTREDYMKKAVPPIRRFLKTNDQIKAIVTIYGVPLRVASPGYTETEQEQIHQLTQTIQSIELDLSDVPPENETLKTELSQKLKTQKDKLADLKKKWDKMAAFDSELALIKKKEPYDLNFWIPNPFYLRFRGQQTAIQFEDIIMVSRLDGSTPKTVKRIINDSIEAEKEGLKGSAFFDARWEIPEQGVRTSGYAYYDQSIHQTAQILNKKKLPVVIEATPQLYAEGSHLKTALYCGWYSLANYIDAFDWQKGSVGYHIASAECTTLKRETNVWCKKMLDNGIAATIGPVGEPYVQAFPEPQIFFHFLTENYMTLAESYLISLPYLSWKMVLIGDPLYQVNFKPDENSPENPEPQPDPQ